VPNERAAPTSTKTQRGLNAPFDQLSTWLKEHKITEVECVISDLTGIARGKIAPTAKFLHERGMRLPESVLLQTVTGDYVDDDIYYDLLDPADIDMVCRPDRRVPDPVGHRADRDRDPRHLRQARQPDRAVAAQRAEEGPQLYADKGWQPIVAPEMEFYLTKRCEDPDLPLQAPLGRSGRAESGRQSFSIDAANEFDPLFEDVYDWCEMQGLDLDTLIHEDGPAQMEINFRHGDALDLADQITVFKRTMREARSSTTWPPRSWPSRSPTSRAVPCTCTRAWSTSPPASRSSPTKTAA
jgi:glutamine synthetase